MAGILDSKSRVIDFALTAEGRRQLASGKLVFSKATVSDRSSFYERDGSGATDATKRVYFETYVSNTDQVTLETDDSGQLIPFGGKNLEFASLSNVSQVSADNFSSLKILLTDDPDDRRTNQFQLIGKEFIFYPASADAQRPAEAKIDEIESLLFDKRLSRKKNFMFLPPVNEDGSRLGYYTDVRQQLETDDVGDGDAGQRLSENQQLVLSLGDDSFEKRENTRVLQIGGRVPTLGSIMSGQKGTKYQTFVTNFRQTTPQNNINLQVYQQNEGESGLIKLDLIDFGEAQFSGRTGHVIFAGRIMNNSFAFPVFVNILTLVLS